MHKYILAFLATVSLCLQVGWAQAVQPSGTCSLETALADAGLFVLQLKLNGVLGEFSAEDNPSGRLDDEDPLRQLPPDSSVPYPMTLAFHFVAIDRSGLAPKIIVPNPAYHAKVDKQSEDNLWILRELWKVSDGIRVDLPIPSIEDQLKANNDIAKPIYPAPPVADSTKDPREKLAKIPCPRCNGEESPMSTCPFCMKRGYIWVDAPPK